MRYPSAFHIRTKRLGGYDGGTSAIAPSAQRAALERRFESRQCINDASNNQSVFIDPLVIFLATSSLRLHLRQSLKWPIAWAITSATKGAIAVRKSITPETCG
jgi:hypothetical protein